MIGFFPSPFPNELWYSVCARYAKILGFSSEGFCLHLFDNRNIKISVDLPSLLNKFASKLPNGHRLTTERIINNHTLLPFYAPFFKPQTLSTITKLMVNDNGKTRHSIARISTSHIPIPRFLKFCPNCIKENNNTYGLSYWNRLHQIPGVLVCPEHKVFLEDSDISPSYQTNRIQLFCADGNVSLKKSREINLENKIHKSLFHIAEDARWLLEQGLFELETDHFKTIYTHLLYKNGFYNHRGIEVLKLSKYIKDYFSSEFLRVLYSNWNSENCRSWLYKFYNCFSDYQKISPLRHLMVIRALGETAKTFFSKEITNNEPINFQKPVKEFVDGPYPCLNPVCKYFRVLRIKEFEIKPDLNSKENFIIISCVCGFKYRRRGKDQSSEDIFRKTWVMDYGKLWDDTLKKLWNDKTQTLKQISTTLGVNVNTLKWSAASRGLRFPRTYQGFKADITPEIKERLYKLKSKKKIKEAKFLQTRLKKREEWINVLKLHSTAGMSDLRQKIASSLAQWLDKNDRTWFKKHRSKYRKSPNPVNWEIRDKISEEVIKKAVAELMAQNGRPIRISKERISKFFEKPNWILQEKFLSKLPISKKLLSDVVESRLQHNLRKIIWAVDEIITENGSSQTYLIAEKAHVHTNFRHVFEIKEALDNGKIEIELSRQC